jgi:hypothetical protein
MARISTRKTGSQHSCFLAFQLFLWVSGVLFGAGRAEAYPWMIKHGYTNCATCHSDPSGGELLTGYGRALSEEVLSTHWKKSNAAEGHEFFQPFFGAVAMPDALLVGGSVRLATLYEKGSAVQVFAMQLDLYGDYTLFGRLHLGGSLGAAKVPVGSPYARAAQITHDQGDGYNLISRTHYVRYDFGDGAHSISLGRLNLPFGVRMSEHVMWVRAKTATDRESNQEHGAALNMNFQDWRFELMAIAGNYQVNPDKFRKRGYSGYAELKAWDGGVIGVSSLITHAGADVLNPTNLPDTRQAHGAFLRASLGHELVLMAEGDLLLHTQHKPGYVGFSQLDFEPLRGFHLLGTGEILDEGYPKGADEATEPRTPGIGKPQLGGWLSAQWFFISHFDARVDAIVRQSEPLQILGQIHVYL